MADMLERVAKLLNQAENAGTEAEADAFMAAAQKLATVHSIDLARARHATMKKHRTVPEQRSVRIGMAKARGLGTLTDLYLGIAAANDLVCTIAHNKTYVYAVGFAEDLDVSEALFASLQVQMAKAADEFRRNGAWQGEKVYVQGTRYSYGEYKPQTWLTARLNFQEAYALRIRRRLMDAKLDEELEQMSAERERTSRPHMHEGELTQHFTQWFFDAHGLDLDEYDSTAMEIRSGLLDVTCEEADGVYATLMPEAVPPWVAEFVTEYAIACAGQSDNDSTALVLVEKREAVAEAAAPAQKRARGTYRGGTSGASSSSGRAAGRAAADRAKLGGSTAIGGVKGAIGA